jgi:putative tryptophan/tyrosine transport system substrate-binding protein
MRRREFIAGLGGLATWPLAARAQQPAMAVIGFLNSGLPHQWTDRLRAFHQGLNEAGYVEGRNVAIDYRWAEDQLDRLPALAADLVLRQVAVITANSPTVAQAAKAATPTIPIVFAIGSDPVRDGLVVSLSRPGGNLTGAAYMAVELGPKLLELLHKVVPTSVLGLLVNPDNPNLAVPIARDLQAAARTLGLQLYVLHASKERDFDGVFASLTQLRAGGLVIGPDTLFGTRLEQLAALARRNAVPAIYADREFAVAGGLMSYGGSFNDAWRIVGGYAGRILKGEKPADLPVQQGTKVVLTINMKTANALGLTIPETLLATADEVIQ